MCGIAGIAGSGTACGVSQQLHAIQLVMLHRGPDDGGTYVSPDGLVGLANRRLAIRDLSRDGHMPMCDPSGKVWITYNGEIYNASELRADLERRGFAFRSQSDTEVVLYGYQAWGENVVRRLRGMFAFALHDQREQRLFLARDPLGIKPLYWLMRGGTFAFASECKALIAGGLAVACPSPTGLVTYLALGSVAAPLTIYRDIHSLEAGHTLAVRLRASTPELEQPVRYWQLPRAFSSAISYRDAVECVGSVLTESVRAHLVSDVPIGMFLSGGVDSGAIVTLAREALPSAELRTCSVVFAERRFDESRYAREVAQQAGATHTEVAVRPEDVADELEHVLASLDQPSNDGINTYFVSRVARQAGLTVALSGIGGDELFGGYPTFTRLPRLVRAVRAPAHVPGVLAAVGSALERGPILSPRVRLGGWLAHGDQLISSTYFGLRGMFSWRALQQLVAPEVLHEAEPALRQLERATLSTAGGDAAGLWDLTSRLELTGYMRHQLLRDTDVMSMAHSLEVRVPFVDVRVVETVLGLPATVRQLGQPKQLLRDSVPRLPACVRDRRDKQGFIFPFQEWMAGPLREPVRDLVQTVVGNLRGVLLPTGVETLLHAFERGEVHWSRVWALAALGTLRA